jgi:murein DD-endopeptidase MepM/ murein hydrolase activator NlpD
MRKITVVIIPEGTNATRQYNFPRFMPKIILGAGIVLSALMGYLTLDYYQLRQFRESYFKLAQENEGLKGEAQLLMSNLDTVTNSLNKVQEYSAKLREITQLRVNKVSQKTGIQHGGIGPLSPEEEANFKDQGHADKDYLPLGVNLDKLVFQTAFDRLNIVGQRANQSALKLQHLLSTLSEQKSLLSSIPSVSPVDGWITSGFGPRISPFTGERAHHRGIDVASPIGTPFYAPADGVVIFSGAKEGFGNFIMVAHGYGVVSRYGHNAQNLVQPGQKVKRGDQLGTVGNTGRTTGPHLHYEVLVDGRYTDPRKFILDNLDTY